MRRERGDAGLTLEELAGKVGSRAADLGRVEGDDKPVSDALLVRLADVFGLDADELRLAARRLPEWAAEVLAADTVAALAALRRWERMT